MRIFVPFDASAPKTRLEPVLSQAERSEFARAMLADVLNAIDRAGEDPVVVATREIDCDVPVRVDDQSLDAAVNARLGSTEPVAVVMADLPLVTAPTIERLVETDGEVVLAPGRGGGTNAFVSRHPRFRVDYHDASIRDHRSIAHDVGADLTEVDSYRLGTDVDEPADLVEVLLHSDGTAATWLRERGFELGIEDGRAGVRR